MARVRLLAGAVAAATLSAAAAAAAVTPTPSPTPTQDPTGAALQASFLWCPVPQARPGEQAYVAFRGSFTLPSAPAPPPPPALLHIFADTRYMLFLDGSYVSRGPGRFNPSAPDYDTVDVTDALAAAGGGGPHTLAVLVHTYGSAAINGRVMYHPPGLTALLEVGGAAVFGTGSGNWSAGGGGGGGWRCSANATEYTPSPVAWGSIPDALDGARGDVSRWSARGAGYNDSDWAVPAPVDGATWGRLAPRALPMPVEAPLPPAALTLLPTGAPLAAALPLDLPAGASVVINISAMAMVYVDLTLEDPAPGGGSVVTVDYALRYVDGAPKEGYGAGTTYTTRPGGGNRVLGGDTWVAHYLVIACTAGRVNLTGVSLTRRQYPFALAGGFASADPFLDALWSRGAATLAAVTDDAYGSDARERNEWLQDPAQPNFITTAVAFVAPGSAGASDARLLRLLLRHAALAAQPDGRILATFPTDRGPSDCHWFIEDYAAQWVEALRWYWQATGDAGFVAWAWPTLLAQMAWFAAHVNATTGLLQAREYVSFDNPLAYVPDVQGATLNAFYYGALVDAAALAAVVGDAGASAGFAANATRVAAAINAVLWNATAGSYAAGVLAGEVLGPTAHAAMVALQRGVVPPPRRAAVQAFFAATYANPGRLHVCSNPDWRAMIAEQAGLNMTVSHYWALDTLYGLDTPAGDAEALGRLRGQWGPMVATGGDAGTLWESFDDSESCHNYGAVPTWYLSTRVLGVRPAGLGDRSAPPGAPPVPVLRALVLEPHLGGLPWANGTVVTPMGVVGVAWAVQPPRLVFTASLPAGLSALTLRLPDCDASSLQVGGAPLPAEAQGRYAVATLAIPPAGALAGSIALLQG